jgi:hypothetical protein
LAALRHGLLLLGGGESVVRMCPPLVFTAEEMCAGYSERHCPEIRVLPKPQKVRRLRL